jgi:hypothetical protein
MKERKGKGWVTGEGKGGNGEGERGRKTPRHHFRFSLGSSILYSVVGV